MRALAAAVFAGVLVVGCSPQPQGLDCGDPTTLVPHPNQADFTGAPLGPLLVRNFREGETTAIIDVYSPGYATKVVIVAARSFDTPLTLRGWRCSDRTPLRFAWAYPFATNSTPAPSAVFAAAGEEAPVIQPMTIPASGVYSPAAPAYFLFASSGKWLLEVRDGNAVIGQAVLLVR
ncbi:MAG TPA: hypothetical protein VIN69_05620 [Candidatus Limnocylindria bacterium]